MYALIFLAVTSILLALILTPPARNLFRKWGIMDYPDAGRKAHPNPIPRVGGVVIALSYMGAFALLFLTTSRAGDIVWSNLPLVWRLFPAAGVMFLVGLLDDIYGIRAWYKLAGQVVAALLACAAGVQVHGMAGHFSASWWSVPLTVFWLVACANAFNLIDGVDGLSAGMGLCATLTMLIAALLQNNVELALATVPLAGCLIGFLRYNFNPASVFLGDCGSLLIGFLLGCFGIVWSEKSTTMLGMAAPLVALAIPLLDTLLAISRRFLSRKPVFGADRGHIHHRLLDRGLRPREVALVFYCLGGLAAVLSLLVTWPLMAFPAIALFCLSVWIGIQQLRYPEFRVAARLLLEGGFRRALQAEVNLQALEHRLQTVTTMDERWDAIRSASRSLGFAHVALRLEGIQYAEPDSALPAGDSWTVRIPLAESDYVVLTLAFGACHRVPVASFAGALRRAYPAMANTKTALNSRVYGLSSVKPLSDFAPLL